MPLDSNTESRLPIEDAYAAAEIFGNGEVLTSLPADEQIAVLRSLLDTAVDAIIAHTPDGRLIYYNDAMCELLGYRRGELAEIPPYGWVAGDSIITAPSRLEAVLHQGQLTFQSTACRRDGSLVPTEVRARRLDCRFGPIVVAVIRDITERIEAHQAVLHLAYHDPLTGVGNRALFDDRIELATADAHRFGDVLGIALLDVNHFKELNDEHGHALGDAILSEIARRLQATTRRQDTVARLGGDEFVVIVPRIEGPADLARVGMKIAQAAHQPLLLSGLPPMSCSCSVGLAVYDPDTDDVRSLLSKAEAAMYAAKTETPQDWCLYEVGMYGPMLAEGEAFQQP